ncbi:MBL fold metallo-hydrolase [Candidatus Galacturonibacter soehngenii]|uniref:MBL fold metallo-hydrolase n=1 Tax=Candidatus Galacturonatibacter soehngenii TaxID=2307010 RepID=A0A7V7QML2_9FIRM|nr:MBL fold metallo-hydrolase [Candidatus Galacturonibacter soehngenii]KAB1439936.1 MBL fold metallo-hydrolase [Candidatus Galacturonibacter soehngenii]MBA4685823.1 MBL fold metallo-hydrolase [Candidatus Galacturonibacter soehngenii]
MRLCSITSGSSGNCIYVGADNTHLIIDTGISGKRIENGLNQIGLKTADMNGILITHEHSDHISGLGVLARRYGIPIYATKGTIYEIKKSKSVGAIPDDLFQEIQEDTEFMINELTVHPFSVSHDAAQPVAYRISREDKSIAIATDLGKYDDYTIDNLKDLDVLLLEANHDINMLQVGSYPYYLKQRILGDRGHLSNELSGRLLCKLISDKLKAVVLGHLSQENNYEELAYETVRLEISMGEAAYNPDDFYITVAKRDCISELITI